MPAIIDTLNTLLATKESKVKEWFSHTFRNTPPFFYNSVDIRHSGYKLAPVDTNIFPAGFNNLTDAGRKRATEAAATFLADYFPGTDRILLIPENHSRNTFYLENVTVLLDIIRDAGKEVVLGSSDENVTEPLELLSASGKKLTVHPLTRTNGKLKTTEGFTPDLILTNNDLTSGIPELLQDIEQPITPPLSMGWFQRRKTSHFSAYNELARSFCNTLEIDPWLITTIFHKCGVINFKEQMGLECVARGIDKVLHRIRTKYDEYGITEEPYVFIKSNMGTYGMGIMTARSGEEVMEMNKKIRNKMSTIKEGETNSEVIIQEGVPTIDVIDGNPAEHMIYLVGGSPVGCIYRINETRDAYGNLNSSGMRFENAPPKEYSICNAIGTIAKLASMSAAWECYEESYEI